MPRRYINWKLVIVLVIGLVVLAVTAFSLRKWQRNRRAYGALETGNEAYEKGLWEEAAINLGRYLTVAQDDVTVILKYAESQINIRPLKRNNVQQAIEAYRTVLRIDKNNLEATMRLVEMYLEMDMAGEAELIATRVPEASQSPDLRRMLAIALIKQRKFTNAATELTSVIKEHPDHILAYEVLGQLIKQRPENFTQAPQFWFDEAVKNNPSSALAYIIRAGFHLRSNDKAKTLTDLEQAEKYDLSDPAIQLRLAREFINANILDKAETHLAAVHKIEPTNQLLWQIWAQLALQSQSKAKMKEIADTGLKELSSQPWDFMPIATELYIRCDELELASDCISKMQQKNITPATTAFLEGLIADRKGNGYKAIECWHRAIQFEGKVDKIRLVLAATLSRLGDKQSAIMQLRCLVSEQPNLFIGHLNLARLLTETGNWAGAAEQALIAKQLSPNNLSAALLYIQAQIQLLYESQTTINSKTWQNIAKQLDTLESTTNGALEVKLLQLQLAMQLDNLADAEALVNELKYSHPSALKTAMAEIELLIAQERQDDAISRLDNLVKQFPQEIDLVEYFAVLLAQKNELEKCEDLIKNTLVRIKEPLEQRKLCLFFADLYNRWNQEEKAYELLNSLAQKLPNDIPVKRQLLRCGEVAKKPEKALQLVNEIKSLEGQNGWQWRFEQAKILFTQDNFKDQYPQIISLLKENLLVNPDDQASRMLLASAYEKAGELQLAVSIYQEALTRSPEDIHIIVPAVAALYKANEYDRADEILRRAARKKLSHPELQKLELHSYLRRGELSSASNILEDLSASEPNNLSIYLSLASLKMQQNSFTEADEILSGLKLREPNSLPVIIAQIESKIRQKKSTEAISLCDEIINISSNSSAYILRARTYAMLGQPEKAQKDFEHVTTTEPNNANAWAAISDFYRSTGNLGKAIASIRKAMSLGPDNLDIIKRAISLFLASGNHDTIREGKDILDSILKIKPKDFELRLFKARSLLAKGTVPAIEQATSILEKITEEQPEISEAWLLLGEIAFRQEQITKAMDIALRGLANQPNDKSLLLLKARSEAVRSPTLAIPTIKALLELEPNNTDTVIYLANIYLAANQVEKTINLLKKQLSYCSNTSDKLKLNIALATALYKNGNKSEAKKQFDLLHQSAPDNPNLLLAQVRLLKDDQLWDQLGQMVFQWYQNHPKDTNIPITIVKDLVTNEDSRAQKTAESILRTILKNNSDNTEAINLMGILLQTTGRSAEAATIYEQIIALEPDNIIAINNLAWILCEEQGKHKQALELVQRGLSIDPDYVDLIDTRGVAYYRLGEFNKAAEDFKRCVHLYHPRTPSLAASYLHLGKTLAKLGQKDEAIKSLKKALELNTKNKSLSAADFADTQHLLKELSRGGV